MRENGANVAHVATQLFRNTFRLGNVVPAVVCWQKLSISLSSCQTYATLMCCTFTFTFTFTTLNPKPVLYERMLQPAWS